MLFGSFHYEIFQAALNGGTKNKVVGTEQMDWINNGFNAKFTHVWMVKRGIHLKVLLLFLNNPVIFPPYFLFDNKSHFNNCEIHILKDYEKM